MRCSHCDLCCKETEMLLSNEDVRLLEEAGQDKDRFARCDKHGYVFLRNYRGYCFFYDATKHRCRAYSVRPLGCRLYPVVCSDENAIFVDDLCPMGRTVSSEELRKKGLDVVELVRRIDLEAKTRRNTRR